MTSSDNKKIGVLMGGFSAEREVSLKSGAAVLKALVGLGYNAVGIDVDRNVATKIVAEGINAAFIALHGRYGEDGAIQGLLELMAIPYTGSGVLASALAMNKIFAKQAFQAAGLTVAPYRVVCRGEVFDAKTFTFPFPVVVKPSQEGSSVGVSIVRQESELEAAMQDAFKYDREILIEQFIKGAEVQVGILEDKALGAIEIVPKKEFYDFEAKYSPGMAEHILPARLPADLYEKVLRAGEEGHRALGCSGYSRVDFLVTTEGLCYILEVNTLPGMTDLSLLPEIARGSGIEFGELVERLISAATLKIAQ
ncbi:D-alanine--D-alanine ligase [Geotalea daltonii FRC-32]|uniref:D-alanine--D-alanine ligase n=1 Tax=Geotalea daltonii (strain DSM 22248 / JCM 15807 / FRC-32) TaxID=316067 RepID=B9M175_GEODF|nr:D-alanine--D-alanine ligase [Geotalea daltonii]ACM19145.1 D-alanine--D-alanine ligase [Geotalea daltonii FRC-32]